MSFRCSVDIDFVSQNRFHIVDSRVMGHVFDIHNSFGRFFDERIYQEELARRCRSSGFSVHLEPRLYISHRGFTKVYCIDMLVEGGIVYELKTIDTLTGNHFRQLLNYLLLSDLGHGKLVNFRPKSVECQFVSTTIRRADRMDYQLSDEAWVDADAESRRLRDTLCDLLAHWGVFLEANLYREALLHILTDDEAGFFPVDVEMDGNLIGKQNMCVLNSETAWHLSTVQQFPHSHEKNIVRLLNHTRLKRIHWINFNKHLVTLKTVSK